MKAAKSVLHVISLLLTLCALGLFFTTFANLVLAGQIPLRLTGLQVTFGLPVTVSGQSVNFSHSLYFFLLFLLGAVGFIFLLIAYKAAKAVYVTPIATLAAAIIALVMGLRIPTNFVDFRPLDLFSAAYTPVVLWLALVFFVCAVVSVAYILVADHVAVLEAGGKKQSILQRLHKWLRDFRSEVKKVIWPTRHDVIKNTVAVFFMCLILGGLIWLFDWGVSALMDLLL